MNIDRFCSDLSAKLASATTQEDGLATAAEEISSYFDVEPHEIGFFSVDYPQHQIHFRWPPIMSHANRIPLKAFNSLVARTANDCQSFIDNMFAVTRHLFMFEHLLVDKAERIPVQKVMSVPILGEKLAMGVIQVVRKGASPDEAGADFNEATVADLEQIAGVLSTFRLL